jgi:hypothetical protein
MTMPKARKRVVAVLHTPRSVPEVIAFVAMVLRCMKNSPYFPDPPPPIELVRKAADELRLAQEQASLLTRGAVEVRDEKLATVVGLMGSVRAHVQRAADLEGEQEARARATIRSAGLAVRKDRESKPVQFHAKLGDEPGTVKIVAPAAARRASYDWEYSLDRGRTWKAMPTTLQARTSLTGVPEQTIVELRYRATTKAGEGGWSGAIGIFVP